MTKRFYLIRPLTQFENLKVSQSLNEIADKKLLENKICVQMLQKHIRPKHIIIVSTV